MVSKKIMFRKKVTNKEKTGKNKTRQNPLLLSFLWTPLFIKFVTVIRTTRKPKT